MLTHADGSPWKKSHQNVPMRRACKRASISPPINFHALRHTWASLSAMAGVPLLVIAKNLGHTDTRMVERHYGHLAQSYIRDAIFALALQSSGRSRATSRPSGSRHGCRDSLDAKARGTRLRLT